MAIVKNPVDTYYLSRKSNPVIQRVRTPGLLAARSIRKPVNYRHSKQQAQRTFVNQVKILWDNLTGSEVATWQSFAATYTTTNRYGDTIMIGSWQWFCRYNLFLLSCNLDTILEAPPDDIPSYDPTFLIFNPIVSVGWFFNVTMSLPSGKAILVQRKISLPYKFYAIPKPLYSYRYFDSSDIEPFSIASGSEVVSGSRAYFVGLKACDEYGRSSGWQYFREVSIP